MATSPITLNGLRVTTAKVYVFTIGNWVVEAVLDIASPKQLPTGKATLTIGGQTLLGTIDPNFSGTFGPAARVRIVGGGGAWDSSPPAQDFHSDSGLSLSTPQSATAGAIGEVLSPSTQTNIGPDYIRSGGPASRVFDDKPWWVDFSGVTHIGTRPSTTPDSSLFIQDFNPLLGSVSFSCDVILVPGTTITDPRFNGTTFTAGDVEQIFDSSGSKGETSVNASQLVIALKNAAIEWTRAAYLRAYRYRLILYQNGNMALQAVTPGAGMPDLIPISPWGGLAGLSQTLAPSQEVLVVFENADPTLPRVIAYSQSGTPLVTTIDATALKLGPSSTTIQLAGGGRWGGFADLCLRNWSTLRSSPPPSRLLVEPMCRPSPNCS